MDLTLENSLQFQPPSSSFNLGADLRLPRGNPLMPSYANQLRIITSDDIDVKAPGIREQMMNPPISFGPHRPSIYDQQRASNQAPMPPYDDPSGKQNSWMFGKWAQVYGNSIFNLVTDNQITDHRSNAFRNVGTWSGQRTGFSALREIRPNSSLIFM